MAKKPARKSTSSTTRFSSWTLKHKLVFALAVLLLALVGYFGVNYLQDRAEFKKAEQFVYEISQQVGNTSTVTKSCTREPGGYQEGQNYCGINMVINIDGKDDTELYGKTKTLIDKILSNPSLTQQTNSIRLNASPMFDFGNADFTLANSSITCRVGYQVNDSHHEVSIEMLCFKYSAFLIY